MAIENLKREHKVEGSSDRVFGLVFTAAFGLVGVWPILSGGGVRTWALVLATVFGVLALARPQTLSGLNRAWTRLGLLLGHVVSPVALGITYCIAVVPTGLLLRLMSKDPLRLGYDPEAETYWIGRDPPGPEPKTLNNQF